MITHHGATHAVVLSSAQARYRRTSRLASCANILPLRVVAACIASSTHSIPQVRPPAPRTSQRLRLDVSCLWQLRPVACCCLLPVVRSLLSRGCADGAVAPAGALAGTRSFVGLLTTSSLLCTCYILAFGLFSHRYPTVLSIFVRCVPVSGRGGQ